MWGPNVPSFEMQVEETEEERWYCVGYYLSPSEKEGEAQRLLVRTLQGQPSGARLLVLGNISANLDSLWGRQERTFWQQR